ncbi:OsmC family protein [Neptunomonas concharum]|uniref:OsmC family protein n=1 Tax=Neptunomonas concharum TaxID=1031538 RepID=A0A5P1RDP4_9GAMM|nr:OsmC family protein [Neptunomonas concharum]QEQ97391.1 OsmC family protein [Neptunomonas concharum]
MRNGISVTGLSEFVNEIKSNPEEGIAKYGVQLDWQSGTRSKVTTLPMSIGPHTISRDFSWEIDEPRQLLGCNHAPNPQEYLLSGVGACILVGFAVGASVMEIQLESLKVSLKGELNLAGFLDIDPNAPIPFKEINYSIEVSGDGTPEQFEILRQTALSQSPNAMTIMKGADIKGELIIR